MPLIKMRKRPVKGFAPAEKDYTPPTREKTSSQSKRLLYSSKVVPTPPTLQELLPRMTPAQRREHAAHLKKYKLHRGEIWKSKHPFILRLEEEIARIKDSRKRGEIKEQLQALDQEWHEMGHHAEIYSAAYALIGSKIKGRKEKNPRLKEIRKTLDEFIDAIQKEAQASQLRILTIENEDHNITKQVQTNIRDLKREKITFLKGKREQRKQELKTIKKQTTKEKRERLAKRITLARIHVRKLTRAVKSGITKLKPYTDWHGVTSKNAMKNPYSLRTRKKQ